MDTNNGPHADGSHTTGSNLLAKKNQAILLNAKTSQVQKMNESV